MTVSFGVDLGNCTCQAAFLNRDGRPVDVRSEIGATTIPSALLFTGSEVLLGSEAENSRLLEPDGFVQNWKRYLGDVSWAFQTPAGKGLTARDLHALMLKQLIADAERCAGEGITDLMLTIPANATDAERRAMHEVAQQAGVRLQGLLHEPTAACLAYGAERPQGRPILVYDLGGGTFDCSIVMFQGDRADVLATEGIARLGGNDLREVLVEMGLERFEDEHGFRPSTDEHRLFLQELVSKAEAAKQSLSARKESTIAASLEGKSLIRKVTREEYEAFVRPLLEPSVACCETALQAAGLGWAEVDVLRVGGASLTPLVSQLLREASGKEPKLAPDPQHAVAHGASLEAARRLTEGGETPTMGGASILPPRLFTLTDVAPHPLGCLAISKETGEERCVVFVEKNTSLPAARDDVFDLQVQGQTEAQIVVAQGEEDAPVEACHLIGEVTLPLDPTGPVARRVKVTYRYTIDGMVDVTALDTYSGESATIRLSAAGQEES